MKCSRICNKCNFFDNSNACYDFAGECSKYEVDLSIDDIGCDDNGNIHGMFYDWNIND